MFTEAVHLSTELRITIMLNRDGMCFKKVQKYDVNMYVKCSCPQQETK